MKNVLVVGGGGALGRAVLNAFKQNTKTPWKTYSFDLAALPEKSVDVELCKPGIKWEGVTEWIHTRLEQEPKFNAIVCVAGGFIGGDINSHISSFERNWKMNARSAFLSAQLASKFLEKDNSLFLLTGAKAAMEKGPDFALGYGLSKAATHHLAKSVEDSMNTICILPNIIDTPFNRAEMPDADYTTWTSLESISSKIVQWSEQPEQVKGKLFVDV